MPKRHMPTEPQIERAVGFVRNALANGDIKPHQFDMRKPGVIAQEFSCNTPLCIGGWVALLLYKAGLLHPKWKGDMSKAAQIHCAHLLNDDMSTRNYRLYMLFYGHVGSTTPKQAVAAMDRYLAKERDPWIGIPPKLREI